MTHTSFNIIVLLFALLALPLRAMECTQVETAPVADGRLDDEAWALAPWQEGFGVLGTEKKTPSESTRFKVLREANGIWLGVKCEDAHVAAFGRKRDDCTWQDDCVEVFVSPHAEINPDPNLQEYYQFIINAEGAVFDGHSIGGSLDTAWECRFQSATARTENGWSLELFLPFSAFMPCDTDAWHLLVARENVLDEGGTREVSAVPQVVVLRDVTEYASLASVAIDATRFGTTLERLSLDAQMTTSGAECFITGEFRTPFVGTSDLKCQILDANGKQVAHVSQRLQTKENGPTAFRIPVALVEEGEYAIRLFLLDEKGMVFQTKTIARLTLSPLAVTTLWPRRNTLLASMDERTARFEVSCILPAEQLENAQVVVGVVDINNTQLLSVQKDTINFGKLEVAVPLEDMSPGEYTVSFRVEQEGKALATASKAIRVLPPQAGSEAYVDAQGRAVINGKPVFLRGFYACFFTEPEVQLLRGAGCNVAHSYTLNYYSPEEVRKSLDYALENGMMVMLFPYPRLEKTPRGLVVNGQTHAVLNDEIRTWITNFVTALKDHPALLGWFLFDEPRDSTYIRTLQEINELLHEIDPAHVTFGCDDSGNGCIGLSKCADILMPDIYPAPIKNSDKMKKPLAGVFNQVSEVVRKCPQNAVCYTPQAFDWDSFSERPNNHRAPTYRETRATVWAAVIAGSRAGIVPYKIGNPEVKYGEHNQTAGIFGSPEMKLGFLEGVLPELANLEQAILALEAAVPATCNNAKVKLATRTLVRDGREYTYVFTANVLPENLGKAVITWPNDNPVRLLGEELLLKQNGRAVTLPYGKYAVHLLTDDPNAAIGVSVETVQKAIDAIQ